MFDAASKSIRNELLLTSIDHLYLNLFLFGVKYFQHFTINYFLFIIHSIFANSMFPPPPHKSSAVTTGLTFVGLVSLIDPPRLGPSQGCKARLSKNGL